MSGATGYQGASVDIGPIDLRKTKISEADVDAGTTFTLLVSEDGGATTSLEIDSDGGQFTVSWPTVTIEIAPNQTAALEARKALRYQVLGAVPDGEVRVVDEGVLRLSPTLPGADVPAPDPNDNLVGQVSILRRVPVPDAGASDPVSGEIVYYSSERAETYRRVSSGAEWVAGGGTWAQVRPAVGGESAADLNAMAAHNLAALQAAVSRANRDRSWVLIPGGDIWISGPWRLFDLSGMIIRGCGSDRAANPDPATVLYYRGSAVDGRGVVEVEGCRGMSIGNFRINLTPSYPCEIGLSSYWNDAGQFMTANHYENIVIDGSAGWMSDGMRFWKSAGATDSNNSETSIFRVRAKNYGSRGSINWTLPSGFKVLQGQSKANVFYKTGATAWSGEGPGMYGYYGHSSAQFYGCGSAFNNTDFYVTNPNDAMVIDGHNMEDSERFLYAQGPSSAGGPITVRGCRIDPFGRSDPPVHNWELIHMGWAGVLNVEGNVIKGSTDENGIYRPAYIRAGAGAQPSVLRVRGNKITSLDGSSDNVNPTPVHPLKIDANAVDSTAVYFEGNGQTEADGGAGTSWADRVVRPAGSSVSGVLP